MCAAGVGIGWGRGSLAVVLLVMSAMQAGAQVAAGDHSPWTRAVDDYLAGDQASAIAGLERLSPDDVMTHSREALDTWILMAHRDGSGARADDAWRLAIRRLQAAALLPLEILSSLSTHRLRLPPHMKAYEVASVEAWTRLGDDDLAKPQRSADAEARARQRRFRAWWQVAYLQFLMNVGRHGDFRRHADQIRLADDDQALRAEFFLLRGMSEESIARMPPAGAGESLTWRSDARQGTLTLGFGNADRWYRRVLAAVPTHIEARVHLGRVLLDLKRPDDAIDTLRALVANPCGTTHCALASLFTGEAHEMRRSMDDAARAYALASSRLDVRQSALVALMQLSIRDGDAANGTGLIGQFAETMPLARRDGPDAWSTYLSGRRQNINAVLRPLREAMLP